MPHDLPRCDETPTAFATFDSLGRTPSEPAPDPDRLARFADALQANRLVLARRFLADDDVRFLSEAREFSARLAKWHATGDYHLAAIAAGVLRLQRMDQKRREDFVG